VTGAVKDSPLSWSFFAIENPFRVIWFSKCNEGLPFCYQVMMERLTECEIQKIGGQFPAQALLHIHRTLSTARGGRQTAVCVGESTQTVEVYVEGLTTFRATVERSDNYYRVSLLTSFHNKTFSEEKMKKLIAIAVIITAFAASKSFAQLQGTASVTMTLAAGGTVASSTALNFGTQVQGATNVTVAASSANAAAFTLTGGSASHAYTVTWSTVPLTQGATTIPFTPSVIGGSTNAQGSASSITSGSTVSSDATGSAWLWVGGTIASIPSSAPTGSYSGTVTLSLAY
jgi:hypothetical protein